MATTTTRLPCISLWQPWANWVALGWKRIETRTHLRFRSLNGKRIGIHVSKSWDDSALELARMFLTEAQLSRTREFLRVGGNIICTAKVTDFRKLDRLDSTEALIDCGGTDRWGLQLDELRSLPVCDETCVRGGQGIFYVSLPTGLLESDPTAV